MWRTQSTGHTFEELAVCGDGELVAIEQGTGRAHLSRDEGRTWAALELSSPVRVATAHHLAGRDAAFTTTDRWATWSTSSKTGLDQIVEQGDVAWASRNAALFRFDPERGAWSKRSTGSRKRVGGLGLFGGAVVAAVGKRTMFRSEDEGATWTSQTLEGMPSTQWLTRLHVLDGGVLGVTNENPLQFWWSEDGEAWTHVGHAPWHWSAVAYGDQLYTTGAGQTWVVEHRGQRAEPFLADASFRRLALGPDADGETRLWALSSGAVFLFRAGGR